MFRVLELLFFVFVFFLEGGVKCSALCFDVFFFCIAQYWFVHT